MYRTTFTGSTRHPLLPIVRRSISNETWGKNDDMGDLCKEIPEITSPQQQVSLPQNIQVLFFSLVSIEPTYSAAGVRSLHLLHQFLRQNGTEETTIATAVHIISPPNTTTQPPISLPTHRSGSISQQRSDENDPTTVASTSFSPSSYTTTDNINNNNAPPKFHYHSLRPNRTDDTHLLLDQIVCDGGGDGLDDHHVTNHPDDTFYIIVYDRYYSEEMYSFQVHHYFHNNRNTVKNRNIPKQRHNFMFLLDMQDMHSLRSTRQLWVRQLDTERKKRTSSSHPNEINYDSATTDDVLRETVPSDEIVPSLTGHKDSDKLLRELASIYRCDLTLVCSRYEYNLLVYYYHIPASKLCIAPLFGRPATPTVTETKTTTPDPAQQHGPMHGSVKEFSERRDFVFVGGMKHDPNVDAIRQLQRIWSRLRQKFAHENELPQLYIYGAQCSDQFRTELHNPSMGLYMEGYYPGCISNVLYNKRVLLSPLRFGAGIKGKHVEAWNCALPIVTTSIGSEGMLHPEKYNFPSFLNHPSSPLLTEHTTTTNDSEHATFGGFIANSDVDFINSAYALYMDKNVWDTAVQSIRPELLSELCHDWARIHRRIVQVIRAKIKNIVSARSDQPKSLTAADTIQEILRHQSNRSTEYFSKYIELKEERNQGKSC